MRPASTRKGFTLIELLVVIAIIAVLIGLLLPAIQKVRESATRTRCYNSLHQMGIALCSYHDEKGSFPPAMSNVSTDKARYMSWMYYILPYMEQGNLADDVNRIAATQTTVNPWTQVASTTPSVNLYPALGVTMEQFNCPADYRGPQAAWSPPNVGSTARILTGYAGYLGVSGYYSNTTDARQQGVLILNGKIRQTDISDGASTTALVGERPPTADLVFGWWFAGFGQDGAGGVDVVLGTREPNRAYSTTCLPYVTGTTAPNLPPNAAPFPYKQGKVTDPCDTFHFWSFHDSGAHFLFADGSVHFITYAAGSRMMNGSTVLDALATRSGNEPNPEY